MKVITIQIETTDEKAGEEFAMLMVECKEEMVSSDPATLTIRVKQQH